MPYTLEQPAGPFWANDIPVDPYESAVLDDTGAVDLTGAAVWVTVFAPDGSEAKPRTAAIVDPTGDYFSIYLGDVLHVAGVYTLATQLERAGKLQTIDPLRFAVQADDGWVTLSWARGEWRDAPTDDAQLFDLLELAKDQCLAFAPVLAEGALVPVGYRKGQMMQARNIWNASKVDPSNGSFGSDTFVLRPFPLDWMVKQQLRPARGIPQVG